jgi:hypothetical protein
MKLGKRRSYELEIIEITMPPMIREALINFVANLMIVRLATTKGGWRTGVHMTSLFAVGEACNVRAHENVDHHARKYE